jgi:hypothetical protein
MYDDDLEESVAHYESFFPPPPKNGWFIRTEHVSLKEGCGGLSHVGTFRYSLFNEKRRFALPY